jgi:flagellar P-ring protein precursor FlgI
MRTSSWLLVSGSWLLALAPGAEAAARLKDLVTIEGVRDNQLVGYGLVVGLAGTGDSNQTVFSAQMLANTLERMGVQVSATAIRVKNTAAVMLTATLPPFAQPGTHIDVTTAAVGDAKNLQGGLLLLTSLKGPDGQVYATAQGPVVTGGFLAGASPGNSKTLNHPTVGRIPEGAIVERTVAATALPGPKLRLQLRHADFTTAARIVEAVNQSFSTGGRPIAQAENSAVVAIEMPQSYSSRQVAFFSEIENLTVEADRPARVVINERTGTIVLGKDVRIAPVAIMQGSLTVEIQTSAVVSQPPPLSSGTTIVTPQVTVGAKEEKARNVVLKQGATVEELVRALMTIGSTPRDIIAILQNLRAAHALDAELEVI